MSEEVEVEEVEIEEVAEEATVSDETTTEEVEEIPEESSAEPKKKGVQKRLDELTREKYEARRQAERERAEREYWQKKAMGIDKEPEPTGKPTADKFETYEDYLEALSDWKLDQRLSKQQQEQTKNTEEQKKAELAQSYKTRVEAVKSKFEDYDEVAHGLHWSPTETMAAAIMESEKGPEIAYWLGSHPEDAERIGRMSERQQLLEMGRIAEIAATPKKKATEAPPPIKPAGTNTKAEKDPSEMTDAEFAAWRRKQIAARRKF